MVNNIFRSNYIFVEINKLEILFSNHIFGLTFKANIVISLENIISILLFFHKKIYFVHHYVRSHIMKNCSGSGLDSTISIFSC